MFLSMHLGNRVEIGITGLSSLRACLGILIVLFGASRLPASAQQSTPSTAATKGAGITGELTTESGTPLNGVEVTLSPSQGGRSVNATTDSKGHFSTGELAPGEYYLRASVPGYVMAQRERFKAGQSIRVTLSKGGVITGRVVNSEGQPVVRATMVAEFEAPVDDQRWLSPGRGSVSTDDRGIYRIYGLAPGKYLVRAGGRSSRDGDYYGFDAPTYYPSDGKSTAGAVTVGLGEEVIGVDITYRNDPGRRIKGTIAKPPRMTAVAETRLMLLDASTRTVISTTSVRIEGQTGEFKIDNVPDGDFDLIAVAERRSPTQVDALGIQRVNLKGGDAKNVFIQMLHRGSIRGAVQALQSSASIGASCEAVGMIEPRDVVVLLVNAGQNPKNLPPELNRTGNVAKQLEADWQFSLPNLAAGIYRPVLQLNRRYWYLASASATKSASPRATMSPADNDVLTSGISVTDGVDTEGIVLVVSKGGGEVRGRVDTNGAPKRLLLTLVPAEPDAAEAVVRYAHTLSDADMRFSFRSVAPGQYWIVTDEIEESVRSPFRVQPAYLTVEGRRQLRLSGGKATSTIGVAPCQTTGAVIQHTPR